MTPRDHMLFCKSFSNKRAIQAKFMANYPSLILQEVKEQQTMLISLKNKPE
jgi:hypothetical protein